MWDRQECFCPSGELNSAVQSPSSRVLFLAPSNNYYYVLSTPL